MKINLLGVQVENLDLAGTLEKIAGFIAAQKPRQVVTLNPEMLFYAQQKLALREIINRAHLVTADGVGILWAAKMAGTPLPARVTGIDLVWRLAQRAAGEGWRLFFLGALPGIAIDAAAQLQKHYPKLKVAGTFHGYFKPREESEVVTIIRQARPDILFCCPRGAKARIFYCPPSPVFKRTGLYWRGGQF